MAYSLIKIDSFHYIKTNKQETIDKAITDGLTVTPIPDDPNAYPEDDTGRVGHITQSMKDIHKAEQDNVNENENRPRIISTLDDLPYHERTKVQYDAFAYDVLSDYFTLMISKQNHIKEILELKFLEGTKAEWDIEGAKTDADLLTEIATLKADETRKRPDPDPIDNTENITNIKLSLSEIPYPDKTQPEIDALSYEELTQYHSNMVNKQNMIKKLIELKGIELTRDNFDTEGSKTYEVIVQEIRTLIDSQKDILKT
jgi:hypothetical protein